MAKTVEQIANDLQVSITTVRLVLNGKGDQYRISAKTQKKIADYVEVFGYSVNHAARSLKLNKTDAYGLVIPRLSNPFFAKVAELLETRCHQVGCQLMISCTYDDIKNENRLVKSMDERNADGIFIVSASKRSQQHHVRHRNKPLVFLDRDFAVENAHCVVTDNYQAGIKLTETMLDYCDHPIHFFAGSPALPTIAARIAGYSQAMRDRYGHHDPLSVTHAESNTAENGMKMMQAFLASNKPIPPQFIVSSLPILEGILSVIRQQYGAIPGDFNIGTFDDHIMLSFLQNNVWSMRQDENKLVEQAFSMMDALIAGENVAPASLVSAQLVTRVKNLPLG